MAEPTTWDLVKIAWKHNSKLDFIKAGLRYVKAIITRSY